MKERDAADRLSRQVDLALAARGRGSADVVSIDCCGDMGIVARLANVDLAHFSIAFARARMPVSRPETGRTAWGARIADVMARRFARPLPISISVLAIAVILLQCTYPGGLGALSVKVRQVMENRMKVGAHTGVQTITGMNPERTDAAAVPEETKRRMWRLDTPAGTWGGNVPEGVSTEVLRFPGYEAARGSAAFVFKTPRFIPSGYELKDVFVVPMGTRVISVYEDSSGAAIVISQMRVGKTGDAMYASAFYSSTSSFEEVDVGGAKAAWFAKDGTLVWERDNVSFSVNCGSFTLGDALKLREGLR